VIEKITLYQILITLAVSSVVISGIGVSYGKASLGLNDTKLQTQTNSLYLSEPIYQAMTGKFLAAKDLSTKPYKITEESFFEQGIMMNVGNVTNNMTFINTHLSPALIQAKGKGAIETSDHRKIDWISSDIGTVNSTGFYFHGIILFNNTKDEKLSFLNNTVGIYEETPAIKRTIWLLK
jgi:hypothetical protein